jgi:hypothetical protein
MFTLKHNLTENQVVTVFRVQRLVKDLHSGGSPPAFLFFFRPFAMAFLGGVNYLPLAGKNLIINKLRRFAPRRLVKDLSWVFLPPLFYFSSAICNGFQKTNSFFSNTVLNFKKRVGWKIIFLRFETEKNEGNNVFFY